MSHLKRALGVEIKTRKKNEAVVVEHGHCARLEERGRVQHGRRAAGVRQEKDYRTIKLCTNLPFTSSDEFGWHRCSSLKPVWRQPFFEITFHSLSADPVANFHLFPHLVASSDVINSKIRSGSVTRPSGNDIRVMLSQLLVY